MIVFFGDCYETETASHINNNNTFGRFDISCYHVSEFLSGSNLNIIRMEVDIYDDLKHSCSSSTRKEKAKLSLILNILK